MKKLLLITWDADASNYLESLFFPILSKLVEHGVVEAHVIQFSWAKAQETQRIQRLAQKNGIAYTHQTVNKGALGILSILMTLLKGTFFVKNYILKHQITHLMPRSTMPAIMVNRLHSLIKKHQIKLIFDADGLPLEERLDYTPLEAADLQYKVLKREEVKMLLRADRVLLRTNKAKFIHLKTIPTINADKFHLVSNGRDEHIFDGATTYRDEIRTNLGLSPEDKLFVYTGSLGPQYALEEMLKIFEAFHQTNPKSKLLLLSRMTNAIADRIPESCKEAVFSKQIDFQEVPMYLSAGDMAYCLRLPAPSLSGIAPIKLGEYLMMGLPVIMSVGIGDMDELLEKSDFIQAYDHHDPAAIQKTVDWVQSSTFDKAEISNFGKKHFSLEKAWRQYEIVLKEI